MFDIQKLTLGEIDKVESLAGASIGQLGEDETPKGKMLAALAFVVKRRQQSAEGNPPSFTWHEAMDLTMNEANDILGFSDAEPVGVDEEIEPNREERRAAAKKAPKKKVAEPDPTLGE